MAPALIGLSARAKIVGPGGERMVSITDFFTGPGSTVLKNDELLTEIRIPNPPAHTAGVYIKYTTRGGEERALVGIAGVLTLEPANGACLEAKIVLGGVAPTPMRARRAEGMLKGGKIDRELARKAAQVASDESSPIDDSRGSAEYKRELVKVIARDAVMQAAELAKSAT